MLQFRWRVSCSVTYTPGPWILILTRILKMLLTWDWCAADYVLGLRSSGWKETWAL